MKLSVVVPVYNEEKNILVLLNKIKSSIANEDEIIVIVDGSSDGTLDAIKNFDCKIIAHPKNLGKGRSLIDGIEAAQGEIVLFIDGDGQDDPSEIPELIRGIDKGYDFVIGSRFVPDANQVAKKRYDEKALSPVNYLGNKALTFLLNNLFSLNIYDPDSVLVQSGKMITLPWELEENCVQSKYASRSVNLNPYAKISFMGFAVATGP